MFYIQFKTEGREAMQIIAIKKYKLAKKCYEILARSKQPQVSLLDHDGETLLQEKAKQ